jgi:hypothetical protein
VEENRIEHGPFEIIVAGETPREAPDKAVEKVRPFAEAGATYWIESMWMDPGGLDAAMERARQGPPQLK